MSRIRNSLFLLLASTLLVVYYLHFVANTRSKMTSTEPGGHLWDFQN